MGNSRIQLRGTCCICGKTHALKGNLLVNHGYTVDYGMFNGVCTGADKVHYGHKDAPKVIQDHIDFLEQYLADLPEYIADRKKAYAAMSKEFGDNPYPAKQMELNRIARLIREQEALLNGGLQITIDGYKKSIEKWVEREPMEVDIAIEEAEKKAERQRVADEKRKERDAIKRAKDAKKLEREEKAKAKHEQYIKDISENNYYRLWYLGEVVEEWQASVSSEKELLEQYYAKREAYWKKVGGNVPLNSAIGHLMFEVRTKADGKGKRLEGLYAYGTPSGYMKMDWQSIKQGIEQNGY